MFSNRCDIQYSVLRVASNHGIFYSPFEPQTHNDPYTSVTAATGSTGTAAIATTVKAARGTNVHIFVYSYAVQ